MNNGKQQKYVHATKNGEEYRTITSTLLLAVTAGCVSQSGSNTRLTNTLPRKCAAVFVTTRSCPVADLPGRRTLQSGSTSHRLVPPARLSTVGNRVFTVAGPGVWNILQEEIKTSQYLSTFCQRLKVWILRKSYPDMI